MKLLTPLTQVFKTSFGVKSKHTRKQQSLYDSHQLKIFDALMPWLDDLRATVLTGVNKWEKKVKKGLTDDPDDIIDYLCDWRTFQEPTDELTDALLQAY